MDQQVGSNDGQGRGEQHGHGGGDHEHGKFHTFFVDGKEFRVNEPTITGAKIMELAGIDQSIGMNLIKEDSTQEPVLPGEEIDLMPGRRFKKAPRFSRG